MKVDEFDGHRVSVLAHCFNLERGVSADVHLRAGTEAEAQVKLARKLECRQDFLRSTGGVYKVQYIRELTR